MDSTKKSKSSGRNERHSAAWGKRLGMTLLLATSMAFGQHSFVPAGSHVHFGPELKSMLAQAKQGSAKSQTVQVIVQYKQVPTATHYAAMQGRGGRAPASDTKSCRPTSYEPVNVTPAVSGCATSAAPISGPEPLR